MFKKTCFLQHILKYFFSIFLYKETLAAVMCTPEQQPRFSGR